MVYTEFIESCAEPFPGNDGGVVTAEICRRYAQIDEQFVDLRLRHGDPDKCGESPPQDLMKYQCLYCIAFPASYKLTARPSGATFQNIRLL